MIVTTTRSRGTLTAVLLLATTLSAAACSAQTGLSTPEETGTASAIAPTADAPKTLPDSVPLASGAELVEAVKSFSADSATGWTAVTLTPAATTLTATATEINQSLAQLGWASKVTGTEASGFVIAGTRDSGTQQQWLNINVTTPVPGSGPAVTYRYASGQNPTSSPSATVTR